MTQSTPSVSEGALEIQLDGVALTLLADRAVWWPETESLLIADPHFGKAATFRSAGLPNPDATGNDLARLDRLLLVTSASKLIVLGDLLHNRRGISEQLVQQVAVWRAKHSHVDVELIRGNHDFASGDPPQACSMKIHSAPLTLGPLQLMHHPDWHSSQPSLAGHLHPKFRLWNRTDELRLPCFWRRNQTLVLPAFGTFVDGDLIRGECDQVFVIAETEVIEVPSITSSRGLNQ
ncbi:MAG: ligase-associated DNA damage response endonuclease PdeM [Planctomycetaceae bacterium]|nr:ligase-associated DNA damage response endonuclease PdeM [Planctomycetaceae bacterium]